MIHLKIIHIFIILLFLKILSLYVDYKFSVLFVITCVFLFYLYFNNHFNIDTSFLYSNKVSYKFKNKINMLLKLVNKLNSIKMPIEIKQKLISNINKFIQDSYNIFNDPSYDPENQSTIKQLKSNCLLYIDLLHDQRINIINIIKSYIITMQNYQNYNFYIETEQNINNTINDIIHIVTNKCGSNINNNFENYKIPVAVNLVQYND